QFTPEDPGERALRRRILDETGLPYVLVELDPNWLSHQPRVFCMEWIDPIYCSGHWVPEMVRIAGGIDELGKEGADSIRIPWEDVLSWAPEVLVIMPCGFSLAKVIEQVPQAVKNRGWFDLPAV